MTENRLSAGVARCDITPPIGFRLQGVMRRIEGMEGIESNLLATALVLADEHTKIVILDCDLVGFDLPLAQRIRVAIAQRVGTQPDNVLLGCTHTHNGPCTARGFLAGPHDVAPKVGEIAALDQYIDNLQLQLVGIASLADDRRQFARVGAGSDHANVAVNREEMDPDSGKVLVGRNPDGTSDRSVDVLRVDDLAGQPIAVLVGYAAHPVVMGFSQCLASQDYPGPVRRIVENATGATCLFLTGASGNQACWSFQQDHWSEQERMGGRIAGAALNSFYQIETRPYKETRERTKSLSQIALYRKAFHDGPTHQILQTASGVATIRLQALPSEDEAEAQVQRERDTLQHLVDAGEPTVLTVPQQLVVRWAENVVKHVQAGDTRPVLEYPIVGFRIDDFVLLGMPGEPFVEIQLATKKRSQATHTMFAGYANGIQGYIPVAETVRQGGMSVSSAVRTYNLPAPPDESAADDVVAAFDKLLTDLAL